MASSLHSYESQMAAPPQPPLRSSSSETVRMSRWEMRISREQVIVLWSVLAGMMVMVFIFGYQAGREEGIRVALEDASEQAVRLPIAQPVAVASQSVPSLAVAGSGQSATGIPGDQLALNSSGTAAVPPPASSKTEEVEFNFSAEEKVKTGSELLKPQEEQSKTAGFAAKPALEMFKNEVDSGSSSTTAGASTAVKDVAQKSAPTTIQTKTAQKGDANGAAAKADAANPVQKTAQKAAPKTAPKAAEKQVAATTKTAAKGKENGKAAAGVRVRTPSRGWYVQASAAKSEAEAGAQVRRLSAAGLTPLIERAEVKGRMYYRVLLGPYDSKEAAQSARTQALRSKVVQGKPFLKYVR